MLPNLLFSYLKSNSTHKSLINLTIQWVKSIFMLSIYPSNNLLASYLSKSGRLDIKHKADCEYLWSKFP